MRVQSFLVVLLPLLGALAAPADLSSTGLSRRSGGLFTRNDWTDAVKKGKERFDDMTTKVSQGVERASTEADLSAELTELPTAAKAYGEAAPLLLRSQLQPFLSIDGDASTFYNIELRKGSKVAYDCDYNIKDGIIIIKNVNKKDVEIQPSEAIFWEFSRVAAAKGGAVDGITGMGVDQITNPDTIALIKRIYLIAGKAPLTDNIELASGTDGFYALIGSANGAFVPYMLQDHPVSLGKKTVSSILVTRGLQHDLLFKFASV